MVNYHLPGLFQFYDLYKLFIPVFKEHREYFYDWCDIGSIYGSPTDCIWAGGRIEEGYAEANDICSFMNEYKVSSRLTLSNSLIKKEHLSDKKCNSLCSVFNKAENVKNGIIISSDILLEYLQSKYDNFYYVSSTTKVITDFSLFEKELNRPEFEFVVPDFRFNKCFNKLSKLSNIEKNKVEFLCNECCPTSCVDRKSCYEDVSRKNLGLHGPDHICNNIISGNGYSFSAAMSNNSFIGINHIHEVYQPLGFNNFKIEGRGLGSALVLEMLLYYMARPEYQIKIRELIYLDSMLDLF